MIVVGKKPSSSPRQIAKGSYWKFFRWCLVLFNHQSHTGTLNGVVDLQQEVLELVVAQESAYREAQVSELTGVVKRARPVGGEVGGDVKGLCSVIVGVAGVSQTVVVERGTARSVSSGRHFVITAKRCITNDLNF